MPASPTDVGDALADGDAAQVLDEFPLTRAIDPQALISEFGAERGGLAMQGRVGDMAHVHAAVSVAEPYLLAPCAAVRVAALAQDFEGRADPDRLDDRVLAASGHDFLGEAIVRVHREGAVGHMAGPPASSPCCKWNTKPASFAALMMVRDGDVSRLRLRRE